MLNDYIQWLIGSPKVISCTQAAQTDARPIAHDAYTRLLERLEPDPDVLWAEVRGLVSLTRGCLVADDTTLDKPYGPHIELVTRHWSGKHRAVVQGIHLVTLLWTDGDVAIPVDWRVFDKARDGLTKNDHLRQMLQTARQRGFVPECVLWIGRDAHVDLLTRAVDAIAHLPLPLLLHIRGAARQTARHDQAHGRQAHISHTLANTLYRHKKPPYTIHALSY